MTDIEHRITRAEREYDQVTNAAFIAKARLKSLSSDRTIDALQVARAKALVDVLEKKRSALRHSLDELENEADRA